jgi:predicted ATPase
MAIKELTVENFKCFKSRQTFEFKPITILTGANSSGKSSVINALLMILQSDFPDYLSTNGEYVNLGDFDDIANGFDGEKIIHLDIKFYYSNDNIEFATSWKKNKISFLPDQVNAIPSTNYQEPEPYYDENDEGSFPPTAEDIIFVGLARAKSSTNYIGPFRQQPQRTNLEKSKGGFKIGSDGDGYIDQIVEWEKRGNGEIKELVKIMQKLQLIESVETRRLSGGRFEILVKPINSSKTTSLSNVGYGISQFLPIIVADLQLMDDVTTHYEGEHTLLLAEPEIHLHPSVQSKFGEYIVDMVNNRKKNYIIETHSEYFLNRIRLAIVKGEIKKEDVKVYFLENKGDDTAVFDIDFTKTGAIKNAPKSYFKTYMSDTMDIALNSFKE